MMASRRDRVLAIIVLAAALGVGLIWLFDAQTTELVDSFASCANQGYPIEQTDPQVCHAGGHLFIGPSAPATVAPTALVSQPFELLVDGDSLGNYPRGGQVIAGEAAWRQFWTTIHASLSVAPPILPVDFSVNDVVVISDGHQTTNGYGLKVTAVLANTAGSVVDYTEIIPTFGCKIQATPSNRYEIITTAKLVKPLNFSPAQESRQC